MTTLNDLERRTRLWVVLGQRLGPALEPAMAEFRRRLRERLSVADDEIIVSCSICDSDGFWDFPGGQALRCFYCNPITGLGCPGWEAYCGLEGEGG